MKGNDVVFTPEELQELREMIEEWVSEGFTAPPYRPAVKSIIEKLGVSHEGK